MVKTEKQKFFANLKNYNALLCDQRLVFVERERGEKMSSTQKEFEHDKLLERLKRCEFPKGLEYKNAFAQVFGKANWWDFLYQNDRIVFEILEVTFDQLKEKSTFDLISRKDSYDKRYLNYYLYQFIRAYFSEEELWELSFKQYCKKICSIALGVTECLENNPIYFDVFRSKLKKSKKETKKALIQVSVDKLLFFKTNCSDFF